MKNLELKNKLFLILILFTFYQKSFSQNCNFFTDSIKVENLNQFNGMINDTILKMYSDKEICLIYLTIIRNDKDIVVLYKDRGNDSNIYVHHYINNINKIYDNIIKFDCFFQKLKMPYSGTYYLTSELVNRDYFDYFLLKYYDNCFQLIPTGSTITQNISCIKSYNKEIYNIFSSFYKEYEVIKSKR